MSCRTPRWPRDSHSGTGLSTWSRSRASSSRPDGCCAWAYSEALNERVLPAGGRQAVADLGNVGPGLVGVVVEETRPPAAVQAIVAPAPQPSFGAPMTDRSSCTSGGGASQPHNQQSGVGPSTRSSPSRKSCSRRRWAQTPCGGPYRRELAHRQRPSGDSGPPIQKCFQERSATRRRGMRHSYSHHHGARPA